jgi:hypothetical protein
MKCQDFFPLGPLAKYYKTFFTYLMPKAAYFPLILTEDIANIDVITLKKKFVTLAADLRCILGS